MRGKQAKEYTNALDSCLFVNICYSFSRRLALENYKALNKGSLNSTPGPLRTVLNTFFVTLPDPCRKLRRKSMIY